MPVAVASFLIPRTGSDYFLLEDKYLRGGLQVLANAEERDYMPEDRLKAGMIVVTQNDGVLWQLQADEITWTELKLGGGEPGDGEGGGGTKPRRTIDHTVSIQSFSYADFSLPMGNTVIVHKLSVSAPCSVEVHETVERIDSNPFVFVAGDGHLVDDGSSMMEDGTIIRNRRYHIWANMEPEPNGEIYFRILNSTENELTVTITVSFKPVED